MNLMVFNFQHAEIYGICFWQMKTHNDGVYALFNKKFSSFALYEGKNGEDFLPYQCSLFRPRDHDSKFIAGMRKWLVDFHVDEGTLESTLY